ILGGYFGTKFGLAPLLGMLLAGILVRNIPGIITPLPSSLTSKLRTIALTVILSRAGIGLQRQTVMSNARGTFFLGVIPVLTEALVNTLSISLILGYPVTWAFLLGFGLAPISPGVIVPTLLQLKEESYGLQTGIIPMMLAASGFDVVIGITGFSICSGILFSESDFQMTALHGPIEIFGGLLAGGVSALVVYALEKINASMNFRTLITMGLALVVMLGGKSLGYSGAASLGTMVTWCAAGNIWDKKTLEIMTWEFAQPFLFPIIGASISFLDLSLKTVGLGFAVVFIGITSKMTMIYFLMGLEGFTKKQRLFIAGGWTAKATVQAALSYVTLEVVLEKNIMGDERIYAEQMSTVMVFAILMCAPFCATWIQSMGRKWLTKDEPIPDSEIMDPSYYGGLVEPTGMGLIQIAKKQMENMVVGSDKTDLK
ncbi:hypothetical protein ROZALSC1DRAFT_31703, partial [Rozella allomycis CSF55]